METLMPTSVQTVAQSGAIHLNHLLVATDFSPAAEVGLSYALLLARLFHAEITLVHAITASETSGADRSDEKAGWVEATELLHNERFKVEAHGTRCSSLCRVGNPSDVIVQTAADCGSDLLILGGFGYRSLPPDELGSTAAFIMRSIPCPTLIVGFEAVKQNLHLSGFRRLIFASSFRNHSGRALTIARVIACACNASIDVVHVRQENEQMSVSPEELKHRGETLVTELNRVGVPASSHLLDPPAGKALAEMARDRGAGLIIFGVEHKAIHPLSRSMISEVIQQSPCPVLTVPGIA